MLPAHAGYVDTAPSSAERAHDDGRMDIPLEVTSRIVSFVHVAPQMPHVPKCSVEKAGIATEQVD